MTETSPERLPRCHRCGTPWKGARPVPGFKETCPQCDAWLHCCLNCRFHTLSAHNQCAVPNTDWVGDRKGLNFCDDFEFVLRTPKDAGGGEDKAAGVRRSLDALLGQGENADPPKPSSFDDLFRA
ncbi:MAG: hypothetical protein GX580_17165 [Candidatus Hydrogenedens sp.]|nr:hypothetical protein [Candidatus Hydrogenedentota bacterium]NLF59358.1 hypothetical protein [Candidatus Hydrogenedens sp.]